VHWCRHRVRFNEVPEKVPKVPGKVRDLVQRQVRFNRVPEIQRRFQEARVQSQVRSGEGQVTFNRDPEKVPEKVWEALVQSHVRFNKVPEKVPEKVGEALVQSQVKFNRVPEKVPEKVWEALVQSQQVRLNRVPEKGPEKPWCKAKSSSTVSEKVAEAKRGQVHLTHGNLAEVFPALGFAARFRKICKNKMLWLLGIPPKLIFSDLRLLLLEKTNTFANIYV